MQVIIYPTDEGGVAVINPAPECGLTIEEIAAKDVPAGKPHRIVNSTEVPSDRTFRGAWGYDLKVNLEKAREIAHAKRRAARDAEMAPLDIQSTIPAKAAQAEAARQAIRDKYAVMQQRIDAASTLDELKAAMPA